MSDYYYIVFVFLIGVSVGMILNVFIEWFLKNYKRKKKTKIVQPQIEVYKKVGSKFDRVG